MADNVTSMLGARAGSYAQLTADDDPEEAAKAYSFSRDTGIPGNTLDGNLEEYQRVHRDMLIADVVRNNAHIQEYINGHALHAKISNDDWGSMDEASQANDRYNAQSSKSWYELMTSGLLRGVSGGGSSMLDAVGYLSGSKELRNMATRIEQATNEGIPLTPEEQKTISARVGNILGGLIDILPAMALGGVPGLLVAGGEMGLMAGSEGLKEAEKAGQPGGAAFAAQAAQGAVMGVLPFHLLGKATTLGGKAFVGGATMLGAGEAGEVIHQFVAQQLYDPKASYNPDLERMVASALAGGAVGGAAAMFARAGKKPLDGTDKFSDEAKKEEAKEGKDAFKELSKTATATATFERSREAFRRFMELRPGTVGISAEGLKNLYGEEIPHQGDGKLGDLPEIVAGFHRALASDTHIDVRSADWLTKIKPELTDEIADDLHHTVDGITVNQGKEMLPAEEGENIVETLELAAGLRSTVEAILGPKEEPAVEGAGAAVMPKTPEEKVGVGLEKEQLAAHRIFLKLQEKVDAEQQAKADWANKLEQRKIEKRQTKEWKDKDKEVRGEAKRDVSNSPRVAVDTFLRFGTFASGKVGGNLPAIDGKALTPEQQQLPMDPALIRSKGPRILFSPDELARMFNFPSGDALLRQLSEDHETRQTLAEGQKRPLGPQEWRNQLIDAEVDTRLEQHFGGSLEELVMKELGEFLVKPTTMERLTEELVAISMNAGMDERAARADLKGQVSHEYSTEQVGNVKSRKFLDAAARAGKKAFAAATEGNWTEAYKQKQQELISRYYAKEALEVEKLQAKWDRNVERYGEREVKGFPQENLNWIHVVLAKLGEFVNRLPEDLDKEIKASDHANLETYLKDKINTKGYDITPFYDLVDATFNKKTAQLTIDEFKQAHHMLEDMIAEGKNQMSFKLGKESMDLDRALFLAKETLRRAKLAYVPDIPTKLSRTAEFLRTTLAGLVQAEGFILRVSQGKDTILNKLFREGAARASHNYSKHLEDFEKLTKEFPKDEKRANELIDNGLLRGIAGGPRTMNGENLWALLVNLGKVDMREKTLRAEAEKAHMPYDMFLNQFWPWLDRVIKPIDVEIANAIWARNRVAKDWHDKFRRDQGLAPVQEVPDNPIVTKHGILKGGYVPAVYDELFKKPGGTEKISDDAFYGPGTKTRFAKPRTGYFAPMDLTLGAQNSYLKDMLRDIAYKPVIREMGKLFYDNNVQNTIIKHWGPEFNAMMKKFVKDLGGIPKADSRNAAVAAQLSETLRRNVVASLIGLNPGTLAKHGLTAQYQSLNEVGWREIGTYLKELPGSLSEIGSWHVPEAAREMISHYTGSKADAFENHLFAYKHSQYLRDRHKAYGLGDITESLKGVKNWPQLIAHWGSSLVALSDALSAVPLWNAIYKINMRDMAAKGIDTSTGEAHQLAVDQANFRTRQAHGSTEITSRPELMRSQNPLARWVSSLYTFFNHIFNRQYEIAWRTADAWDKGAAGDIRGAMEDIPKITSLVVAYVIMPAIIEELVTPMTNDEKESWGKKAAKMFGYSIPSSVPVARDIAHSIVGGHDPSLGLFSTGIKEMIDLPGDFFKKDTFGHHNTGMMIQHTAELAGLFTGFPVQLGKTARFLYNYEQGYEHPHGTFWSDSNRRRSFIGGLRYGTADVPKR